MKHRGTKAQRNYFLGVLSVSYEVLSKNHITISKEKLQEPLASIDVTVCDSGIGVDQYLGEAIFDTIDFSTPQGLMPEKGRGWAKTL